MTDRLKQLTAEIVSSYVEANKIGAADLPDLIQSTLLALNNAGRPAVEETDPIEKPTRAQIRKSITPDALISFVDGHPYRMLKRHLAKVGLTPVTYRARFDLPDNYPMTAFSYSARRSAIARSTGLGRKTASEAIEPPAASGASAKKTPGGETAGPGARVPKAVRSLKLAAPDDSSP
jgi:predicted transcriptional regulator